VWTGESAYHPVMPPDHDIVSASEVAAWVYCPESWRLAAAGYEASNRPEQEAGRAHHADKAAAERVAGGAISLGLGLIVLALLTLGLLWFLRR
jgi:hypothetical protein